jgi:hypothetical protein
MLNKFRIALAATLLALAAVSTADTASALYWDPFGYSHLGGDYGP